MIGMDHNFYTILFLSDIMKDLGGRFCFFASRHIYRFVRYANIINQISLVLLLLTHFFDYPPPPNLENNNKYTTLIKEETAAERYQKVIIFFYEYFYDFKQLNHNMEGVE